MAGDRAEAEAMAGKARGDQEAGVAVDRAENGRLIGQDIDHPGPTVRGADIPKLRVEAFGRRQHIVEQLVIRFGVEHPVRLKRRDLVFSPARRRRQLFEKRAAEAKFELANILFGHRQRRL